MKKISDLKTIWATDKNAFANKEIGGLQSFVKDVLENAEIFNLKQGHETSKIEKRNLEFTIETSKENRRADFVIYIAGNEIVIPVEVEKHNNIKKGVEQLFQYQKDWRKKYGILTDGNEWRFYKSSEYKVFYIEDIFANPTDFRTYWNFYIKPENYYIELFNTDPSQGFFNDNLDLNVATNRITFFDETTLLIQNFKSKLKNLEIFEKTDSDKVAVETSYAYLIQFILYKVLVDSEHRKFKEEYNNIFQLIRKTLKDADFYLIIINKIKIISEYISENVYKPFILSQEKINKKLAQSMKQVISIEDIAPWLDILLYINRYNFAGLKNEIFGFIYENFLKDLYEDKNKGQYFTDPDVVNFMLDEIGFNKQEIKEKAQKNEISIIDPSCGAGTFLYSATDRIIDTFDNGTEKNAKYINQLIEKNIFGIDIELFPLYLAEMNILMRLLPLIVNDNYDNPFENKIKIFKTKDSISEFLETGITSKKEEINLFSHFQKTSLDYPSFMRDEKDLEEMILSMQEKDGMRNRFDYVIGNPPYIDYNSCCRLKIDFTQKINDKTDTSINFGDIYGVNLHSVPGFAKSHRPNLNLYSFFICLGLALLKNNGRLSFIIPQTLLTTTDLDVLRYHLAKNATIEKIITFEGKLFIGRGLKQNKPVATSSLIFIVKKQIPKPEHKVKFTFYETYNTEKEINFAEHFKTGKRINKEILQTELLKNISNWNVFIKEEDFVKFYANYNANNNISIYYNHKIAKNEFDSNFYFDGGYNIDEKQILETESDYMYPKTNNLYYNLKDFNGFWKNERLDKDHKNFIGLRQGNQAYNFIDSKYKIIWSYANAKRFFYTDKPVIWARNQYCGIGSNNRKEILYLSALLNSEINFYFLHNLLKTKNEKDFLLSLTSIKNFVKIPKITDKNKHIKEEIIKLTEKLLELENYQLKDFVEFTTTVQKFSEIRIYGNILELFDKSGKALEQKIKSKPELVKQIISAQNYVGEISLQNLKYLEAIDKQLQTEIKKQIDDLVFCLYFDVEIENLKDNEFYKLINQ